MKLFLLLLLIILSIYSVKGITWTTAPSELKPAALLDGDQFGTNVEVDGDKLAVSATNDDGSGSNAGIVYTFTWSGTDWVASTVLEPAALLAGDRFGYRIAMSGDKLAVSADLDDGAGSSSGIVYTYTWSGSAWVEGTVLQPAALLANDKFGSDMSMSGDKLAVAAQGDDGGGGGAGAVYTYTWDGSNWVDSTFLLPSSLLVGDQFGRSVSMSGDKLAVGASGDDERGSVAGAAFTFTWDGSNWVESTFLLPSELLAGDVFGNEVSMDGDKLAVGAYGDDAAGADAGIVYTFEWNSSAWVQTTTLLPAAVAEGDRFAQSISLKGNVLAVSADLDAGGGTYKGIVYTFTWDGSNWVEDTTIEPAALLNNDQFGYSLSLTDDKISVGAYKDDGAGTDRGVVYTYTYTAPVTGAPTATPTAAPTITSHCHDLEVGAHHGCVMRPEGTIHCWGRNNFGQLGDGTNTDSFNVVTVSGINNAVHVSSGHSHSCALLDDTTVKCWGSGTNGELGDNLRTSSNVPITVPGLTGVTKIVAGRTVSCAIMSDTTVKCWGNGASGEMGDGANSDNNVPTTVTGLSNVIDIDVGSNHVCVILSDNTMKCWGYNVNGQLGDGSTTDSNTPVTVSGATDAKTLSLGHYHSCYITTSDAVKCWGSNSNGQSGPSTSLTPLAVTGLSGTTTSLSAGYLHTCSVQSTGDVYCWGNNDYGQLGVTSSETSTPVISQMPHVEEISCGWQFCCGLTTYDAIGCWGRNDYYQLAQDTVNTFFTTDYDVLPSDTCPLPTASPSTSPTKAPSASPTVSPTKAPSASPTASPTGAPSTSPTSSPSKAPTGSPTTATPTTSPSKAPTGAPTSSPTESPTTPYHYASDGVAGDYYCSAISAWGSELVVANDDASTGTVYVYNDFEMEQIINRPVADFTDDFGQSVAVWNDKLVIGATDNAGGKAFLYTKSGSTWSLTRTIQPSGLDGAETFGAQVAVSDTHVFVSNPKGKGIGATDYNVGHVYVYDLNGLNELKIELDSPTPGDYFGKSLAGWTNRFVAGTTTGVNDAYVYVYDQGSWSMTQVLAPIDGLPDSFGESVAMCESRIAVGKPSDDYIGLDDGSVYIFKWNNDTQLWEHEEKLIASIGNDFGQHIAFDDDEISIAISNSFALYSFNFDGTEWGNEERLGSAARGDVAFTNNIIYGCDPTWSSNTGRVEFFYDPTLPPTVPTVEPTKAPTNEAHPYHYINGTNIGTAFIDTAMYRNWLAVAHYQANGEAGLVRTYYYANETGWTRKYDIELESFQSTDDWFGYKVAIWGYKMVVASRDELHSFEKEHNSDNWHWKHTIDMSSKSGYASTIQMTYDHVFVGYSSSNVVVVFEISPIGWLVETQEITGTFGFGHTIAVNDNMIAIANNNEEVNVYTFDGSTWNHNALIIASDQNAASNFGSSLALHNETVLVVGAPGRDGSHGALYTYTYEEETGGNLVGPPVGPTWGNEQILLSPDGEGFYNEYFGSSMSYSEGTMITTAWGDENGDGSVFVYDINGTTVTYDQKLFTVPGFGETIVVYGSWFAVSVNDEFDFYMYNHKDITPEPTRSPTVSPTMSPTASPTRLFMASGRGDLCFDDLDCLGTLICSSNKYCSVAPLSCTEHRQCFERYVPGYLPQCNFANGVCQNILLSTCRTELECASEAKTYDPVVNTKKVEVNTTNTTDIRNFISSTIDETENITGTNIRITASENYSMTFSLQNTTQEAITNATIFLACGDVNELCNTDVTVETRRRVLADGRVLSDEVITLVVSFDIDEDAYKTLLETGVDPSREDFIELLAEELGLTVNEIALNEYLPDEYAVEVAVTDTFSGIYEEVLDTLETVDELIEKVISEQEFSEQFQKQEIDQCPPEKTCSYRGTCNTTTGLCDCVEGFTGALCKTVDDTQETIVKTTIKATSDIERIRIINATSGETNFGGAAISDERVVYYYYNDYVSIDDGECPQPTYNGTDWPLVYAKDIGTTGGSSCVLNNFNNTRETYVCCFVRNYGLLPVYQYSGDTNSGDTNGDEVQGRFAMDSDGNSKQNTETRAPTTSPTLSPSSSPTLPIPTTSPTNSPTLSPSSSPTTSPTNSPTSSPSKAPTGSPTTPIPTASPTGSPSKAPSSSPSKAPTGSPTTGTPTTSPTGSPSKEPTSSPSKAPTGSPTTGTPTASPTGSPSKAPTESPTREPTRSPTTGTPTTSPTPEPTGSPTITRSPRPPPEVVSVTSDNDAGIVVLIVSTMAPLALIALVIIIRAVKSNLRRRREYVYIRTPRLPIRDTIDF
jgi:alpha-tubulin suppressor-like RCC1 family protein